jgi:CrcB protein
MARYAVGELCAARLGTAWPWGTFLINVSGCFLIGFFLTFATARPGLAEAWRYLFPIGFVGGYTTFSTYAWETVRLAQTGAWVRAASYVIASTLAGWAAVLLAILAARRA